ncbi:MAG: penicillin-binding protein 2 [Desulfomonilaceae bacterium]|nr:penicillin-binding protein 2 [Desulfomonilaceae bacterium]
MSEALRRIVSGNSLKTRLWIASALMLVVVVILVARLWHLQMIRGSSLDEQSLTNRVRLIRLQSSRGRILDCAGRVLAENRPNFRFSVMPAELQDSYEVIRTCGPVLGLTPERMRVLIQQSKSIPKFLNYPIKKNVSLEQLVLVQSRLTGLKGVTLEARPYRRYNYGKTLCHVLGTMGEISRKELVRGSRVGYRPGDLIGKSGIEKEYETYLKGNDGWEQIEIDARGRQLAVRSRRPAEAGSDVILTVDALLQRYIEEIFVPRAGAVVAVDPDSGRVLAIVSKPDFDLNLFSPSISEVDWKDLNSDPLHPLENRAIRGLYSPASTFKIVAAAAALAEKIVTPKQAFECAGRFDLAGKSFRCWNQYGHGKVDLHRAIVESCDIYFYKLGLKMGADRMAKYASLFGLGMPSGLGLPQELPGLIPTSQWKRRNYGDYIKDGEMVAISIGQGSVVTTPIQLAMMTAALANDGKLLRPAIVSQIRSPEGGVVYDHAPVVRWDLPLDDDIMSFLHKSFLDVVDGAKGTGKRCRIPGITVHAKTGTSQVISFKQRPEDNASVPYHERSHALFVAYVKDRPKKIALVVVVEHGGGGGTSAAPIARKILAKYYGVPDPGDPEE